LGILSDIHFASRESTIQYLTRILRELGRLLSPSGMHNKPYSKANEKNPEKTHQDRSATVHPTASISIPVHHGYLLGSFVTFIVKS